MCGSAQKLRTAASSYTFATTDAGTKTFENGATLITPGSQTITATDTAQPPATGSAVVTVAP